MAGNKSPHNLSEAIRRLESHTTGNGRGQLGEDFEKLKSAFDALKEDLLKAGGETFENSKERAKEFGQTVDRKVQEHPWYAMGAIGLVAFLIGFLLGRKD